MVDPLALGEPAIRITAMPADANPAGDIFGGWLMAQMDMAAGIVAARTSKGRAATIALEGMKFHHPVHVGDEVSVYAKLSASGRTSMTIDVETWRRARTGEERQMVTQARFFFVAIDENRKPRPLPRNDLQEHSRG
ncbi:acyl-CoA thioesterase YciA [Novosphingobium hassiacum]|uniref:Acyl-CoA thioesterase YciA n=1 Tax=Novosphingobium hassiacum TaxID=173676 RepID=A0A7W6EWF7_9SPHN|nr:acyl-CoA thioesterase [Novosphingobium hassiacum]MBB3861181.1 acyl-CoA thioesterase YciA [Novosphingobium hassiacum]